LYDFEWQYDQINLIVFGHFKTKSVCDRIIPKNSLKHGQGQCFWFFRQLRQYWVA